ncbi:NfeD family protein [Carboxylicivirga sp. N1Y90]|uniref:NfeD family protein n=1 Tax=Carboxylicivirga fragile TaxID=3417571 RepID=UPI003D32BE69|nr:NfeD family protein [Marinilabiliaceae bacterium N1Y90]
MDSIQFLSMSLTEILLVLALILIVIDIFFASDIPTHIAWVLTTLAIVININVPLLYQVLIAVLIWFALVAFHYTLWRKVLEKINDTFIAPRKHTGGIQAFIGQKGIVTEVDGKLFVNIADELHQFESEKELTVGETYQIINTKSNKLII